MIRSNRRMSLIRRVGIGVALSAAVATTVLVQTPKPAQATFQVHEASIEQIQHAIINKQVTTVDLVNMYLARIKKYNGQCVQQPEGILGPIITIPRAQQVNALATLNLRPAARKAWGFDDRKARTLTGTSDDQPKMPDALETALAQDRHFAQTGQLAGPAARCGVGDQGPVRHVRHAYHSQFGCVLRQRPSARRLHFRSTSARCWGHHPG
jgi:amidase